MMPQVSQEFGYKNSGRKGERTRDIWVTGKLNRDNIC